MAVIGFRDSIRTLSPPWLRRGVAEKFLYSLAAPIDALMDKAVLAVRARFAPVAPSDALPYIGADRTMPAAPAESDASYGARLQRAFDTWRRGGSPWAMLGQLGAFFAPLAPAFSIVNSFSIWDYWTTGQAQTSPPTHVATSPGDWNWDGFTYVQRFWLIIDGTGWVTSGGKLGTRGKLGSSGKALGVNIASSYGRAMKSFLSLWQPDHASMPWLIVNLDPTNLFKPGAAAGDPSLPDGNFGRWSKIVGGVYVPARFASARYADGVL